MPDYNDTVLMDPHALHLILPIVYDGVHIIGRWALGHAGNLEKTALPSNVQNDWILNTNKLTVRTVLVVPIYAQYLTDFCKDSPQISHFNRNINHFSCKLMRERGF
jgi:hypothetical protein